MLPQPAERLNAFMPCQSTELEIAVECLHVDATSLRRLRDGHAPARVRARTKPATQVLVADIDSERLRAIEGLGLAAVGTVLADATDAVAFAAAVGAAANLCISCVDRPGVEPACILATEPRGHVLFFSMATDFARAALSAEGLGSAVTLEIGNGWYPGHADLVVDLLRRHPAIWCMLAAEATAARLT
jgi:L-erythro-3,5-diaminohexanoate dehydrogenase